MNETVTLTVADIWRIAVALAMSSSAITALSIYLLARFTKIFDTYVAEKIKASISERSWVNQEHWRRKCDSYFRLIQCLGRMRTGLALFHTSFEAERQGKDWAQSEGKRAMEEVRAANDELVLERDLAPMILSEPACRILDEILSIFTRTSSVSESGIANQITQLNQKIEYLRNIARHELQGLSPPAA